MTILDMAANALYQRHCEAQQMYALTWERLPAHRKEVWRAVAHAALDLDTTNLRCVEPWQDRPDDHRVEIRELAKLPLKERLRIRNRSAA